MANKKMLMGMLVIISALGLVLVGCDTGTNGDGGDTTAPKLSLQAVAEYEDTVNGTTATVLFTSDEAGTYYVQVLSSATAAPDSSALAGSSVTGTVTANTATIVPITGLTKDTAYKAHVTVKDAAGNFSAVWSSGVFTTTQRTDDTNPFIGTWIQDRTAGTDEELKVIATSTTWEAFVIDGTKICSGTLNYAGMPSAWLVTWTIGQPYTGIKVGAVGTATIDSSGKLKVATFDDEGANGTYSKQP